MSLKHVRKYVHCEPSMIDWFKGGNIAKMLQKVCKKFSDQFASSLWTWSSENSSPFFKVSCKSDKGLWRFCESIFACYYCNLTSVLSKCSISVTIGWIEKCILWKDLMIFPRICSQICLSRSVQDWLIYRREHCKNAAKSVQKVIGSICIISLNMILAKIGSLMQSLR